MANNEEMMMPEGEEMMPEEGIEAAPPTEEIPEEGGTVMTHTFEEIPELEGAAMGDVVSFRIDGIGDGQADLSFVEIVPSEPVTEPGVEEGVMAGEADLTGRLI